MDIIIRSRCTGKTKELVEKAIKNNGLIVCKNPQAMITKIRAYGYNYMNVTSYDDFLTSEPTGLKVYIDDLDVMLKYLNVVAFTMNEEE